MDPEVKAQLTKLVSVRLCPPALGQALMDLVVNSPQPGEPSYQTFMKVPSSVNVAGFLPQQVERSTLIMGKFIFEHWVSFTRNCMDYCWITHTYFFLNLDLM